MTVHTPLRADDVRRSYARWAGHYDFTFALFGRKYVKKVVNRLNDETHGNQVLDVGCGTGLSIFPFLTLIFQTVLNKIARYGRIASSI